MIKQTQKKYSHVSQIHELFLILETFCLFSLILFFINISSKLLLLIFYSVPQRYAFDLLFKQIIRLSTDVYSTIARAWLKKKEDM